MLRHGGWELDDVQGRHAANPDTFWLPSAADLERMWLWVETLDGDDIVGVLQNMPLATHTRLVIGARVGLRRTDIIDLELEPPVEMDDAVAAMAEVGFPALAERDVLAP